MGLVKRATVLCRDTIIAKKTTETCQTSPMVTSAQITVAWPWKAPWQRLLLLLARTKQNSMGRATEREREREREREKIFDLMA